MSDAMVSPLERSFGKRLALPTTIMTAMVSPSALPLPSRKARKMLRREEGRISLRIMYAGESPRALASKKYFAFNFTILSVMESTIKGKIKMESRVEASKTQEPVLTPIFKKRGFPTVKPIKP